MTDEELKVIEDRALAAMPPPWRWNLNLKSKHLYLESLGNPDSRLEVVMDFVRWGMGGARPRFQSSEHLMTDAEAFAVEVPGRQHHASWFMNLGHPDAVFIAHARKDVAELLAEVHRLRELEAKLARCEANLNVERHQAKSMDTELQDAKRLNGKYRTALEKILLLKDATPGAALDAVWIAKDALPGTNHMEKRSCGMPIEGGKCSFFKPCSDHPDIRR